MLRQLATPGFWVPGWRQAPVFAVLVVLGLLAWGMGSNAAGGAPFFGPLDERPFNYGFPFYPGFNLYMLLALLAGFLFPRCFYLWGAALLLAYPFAEAWSFARLEAATDLNVVVPDGVYGWLSVAFGSVAFAVFYGSLATGLSAAGVGLRLVAGHLLAGRR